jgi:hypothetical protein
MKKERDENCELGDESDVDIVRSGREMIEHLLRLFSIIFFKVNH